MAGYGCNYWADSMDIADDYSKVIFNDCEQNLTHTLTREDILKRMEFQWPEEDKVNVADFVINNDK